MDDMEQCCPHCKTTKYRNPSLKLLVNICGHSLCENCVEKLFFRGSGSCPECGTALRRNQYRLQLFEDPGVEKEVDIRRTILKDFNKQEEDFASLQEYNDYLEEIEVIIFNLTNSVDVEATKKKLENHRKENKEMIKKNMHRQSQDQKYLNGLLLEEKKVEKDKRDEIQFAEKQAKNQKKINKEALLDELMFSDMPADQVIASHTAHQQDAPTYNPNAKKAPGTSSSMGLKVGVGYQQESFLPVPKVQEIPYEYRKTETETYGPPAPSPEELESIGYNKHVRAASPQGLGGGYSHNIACFRALQEAFSGLVFSAKNVNDVSLMETS
ncbi:CDK-activating kinase assembly factor MAT1-like [Amphiura filiformis]|uniref:CDK-activating kinase assembly factor MAT1-like n=1 Tax=Amphiura filiformis TaxID=82378 RepID=UPI003B2177B3